MKSFEEMKQAVMQEHGTQAAKSWFDVPMKKFKLGESFEGTFHSLEEIPWDNVQLESLEPNKETGELECIGVPFTYQIAKFFMLFKVKPGITVLKITPVDKVDIGGNSMWELKIDAFNNDGSALEEIPVTEDMKKSRNKDATTEVAVMASQIRERMKKQQIDF